MVLQRGGGGPPSSAVDPPFDVEALGQALGVQLRAALAAMPVAAAPPSAEAIAEAIAASLPVPAPAMTIPVPPSAVTIAEEIAIRLIPALVNPTDVALALAPHFETLAGELRGQTERLQVALAPPVVVKEEEVAPTQRGTWSLPWRRAVTVAN